jgi:hypothetical protein
MDIFINKYQSSILVILIYTLVNILTSINYGKEEYHVKKIHNF